MKQVLQSGAVTTGLKNTAANAKPIVENLKKQFNTVDTQAFKAMGQEIILGSGIQAAVSNTKSTNKIKTIQQTTFLYKAVLKVQNYKSLISVLILQLISSQHTVF